jgi:hypothetical protein
MSGAHSNVGPELRHLAETILAILDPAIQAAVGYARRTDSTPGKCQQRWCPLCALAALAADEEHPLSSLIAEHGASLIALIRAMVSANTPLQHDPESNGGRHPRRDSSTSTACAEWIPAHRRHRHGMSRPMDPGTVRSRTDR